jgi:hypothetical protein
VGVPPCPQHLWINASAVVANDNAQLAWQVFNFRFDPAGCGVPQRIQERFSRNPINLLLNCGYQGPSLAKDDNTQAGPAASREVVVGIAQRFLEAAVRQRRRAQAQQSGSPFVEALAYQVRSAP